eukprot:g2604.t1
MCSRQGWIFLIQGTPDGGQGEAGTAVNGGDDDQAEAIVLPHPRTGETARFMLRGGELLEVQKATPRLPSSWFVGDRVVQDGGVHIATRVDPLFLALPLLEKTCENYSPLDQILASPETPHSAMLRGCAQLQEQLAHLCDTSDAMGPDMPLFRLNEVKAMRWLQRKVERLACTFAAEATAEERAGSHAPGFISSASTASRAASTGASASSSASGCGAEPTEAERRAGKLLAAQVVLEYLDPNSKFAWGLKLASACGLKAADLSPSKAARKKQRQEQEDKARKWDEEGREDDTLRELTRGAPPSKKQKVTEAAKKQQTLANKQLAKVNTKGMKSMFSFFKKK